MADPTPRERLFRLSLRELLVLFVLLALAVVSLQFASPAWETVAATITIGAFAVAVIVSLVDRQARQAFAIGFAASMVIYGVLLSGGLLGSQSGNLEFNPETGKLPTTRLLRPVFAAVAESRWIDFRTGREVLNYDPQNPGPDMQFVSLDERPERAAFMRIGHCWWAIVLGYLGGWFARFVYLRRVGEAGTLASGRR
jgi:hypothetical protein